MCVVVIQNESIDINLRTATCNAFLEEACWEAVCSMQRDADAVIDVFVDLMKAKTLNMSKLVL